MEQKKMDRRTKYTRQLIKDTLLEELRHKSYSKISVSSICKIAEINRGTFYLHFLDLNDVLDDIFTDFLSDTTSVLDHVLCPMKQSCTYPFCEKIQKNSHYHVLFLDDITASRFMERFTEAGKEAFITRLMKGSVLTFEQAESLFYFQMNGCLAFNRLMIKNHSTDWTQSQKVIDQFIKAGLEHFMTHDQPNLMP